MNHKKIILFGGTFDPVHLGHTTVASAAAEYIGADKTIFIPAKRSPLKVSFPRAGDIDRFNMIKLAISNKKYFEVSDYELNKSAPSYTLDTVRYFQTKESENTLYWLIGADSIDDLIYWHHITELIDECIIATMYRANFPRPDFTKYESLWGKDRIDKLQANIIPTPLLEISSTQVRERITSGKDITQLLDISVVKYIEDHLLYKNKADL